MMADAPLEVTWIDHHREPQCVPDPAFPEGRDTDLSQGAARSCATRLPYPAKRCGMFLVVCPRCNLRVTVTTAGRPDDPRSLKVACK